MLALVMIVPALLILLGMPAVASFLWARTDTSRGVFHPVKRSIIVAGVITVLLSTPFFLFVLSVGTPGEPLPAVVGLLLRGLFYFAMATLAGLTAYLFGHGGRRKPPREDEDAPVTRMDETGNPYQPSSL